MGSVALEGFGGGGGAGLNFKVVGGTAEPTSPSENMIWVNTDVEITSWMFNAMEPETPEEGMVWFTTGTSSTVEFNALKKNGIQVYPVSAKQYVNGAWVDVTAKSYQNGAWVGWNVWLINGGTLPTSPFGTLTVNKNGASGATFEVSNAKGGLYTYVPSTTTGLHTAFYITPQIDITGFSKLTVKWKAHGTVCKVGFVSAVTPSTQPTFAAAASITQPSGTYSAVTTSEIDIKNLSGNHTFCVNLCGSAQNYTGEILVYSAMLS